MKIAQTWLGISSRTGGGADATFKGRNDCSWRKNQRAFNRRTATNHRLENIRCILISFGSRNEEKRLKALPSCNPSKDFQDSWFRMNKTKVGIMARQAASSTASRPASLA